MFLSRLKTLRPHSLERNEYVSYYMAIDAGTGSVRAVIVNQQGELMSSANRSWEHDPEPNVPGSMSFSVDRNWTLVCEIVREAIHTAGLAPEQIRGVSSTSMREGIVLLDEEGTEIWACANVDARAEQEVRDLAQESGIEKQLYSESGQTFALSAPPRLLWLKRNRPEIYDRAHTMLMLSEWVLYRLSGERVMEPSNGSTSGMLSLGSRDAAPQLADVCDLKNTLIPRVVEPGTVIGHVTKNAAAEAGLTESTAVVVGGGDAQLAALGLNLASADEALIVAGTFWQQLVNLPQPVVDPDMRVRVNAAAVPNLWQAEAIAFHAGTAIRWFRDTFAVAEVDEARTRGVDPIEYLISLADEIPIGSDGVIPIFSDVMNYSHWKHAAPSFLNLSLEGGSRLRAAMFRSLMENAAIVAGENLKLVEEFSGVTADTVVFAGGSAKSKIWAQMLADVLNREVRVPNVTEATALGAAACAAAGVGDFATPSDAAQAWNSWAGSIRPRTENHDEYLEVIRRWKQAYAAQRDLMNEGITTPMWQAPGA